MKTLFNETFGMRIAYFLRKFHTFQHKNMKNILICFITGQYNLFVCLCFIPMHCRYFAPSPLNIKWLPLLAIEIELYIEIYFYFHKHEGLERSNTNSVISFVTNVFLITQLSIDIYHKFTIRFHIVNAKRIPWIMWYQTED